MNKYIYIHCPNIGETNKEKDSGTEYLKIDGENIKILDDYITQSIISEHSDQKKWKLCYFANTEYSIQFYVYINNHPRDTTTNKYSNNHSKGMIVDGINLNELTPTFYENISKNIRGSKTLTESIYCDHAVGKYCIDGGGIVWISEIKDDKNALRFIYVYLLARAYEFSMQKLIQQFATIHIDYNNIDDEKLLKLKQAYYQVCNFNLLYFTNFPVKPENNLFRQIWTNLSEHFKLVELNQELSNQALEFKKIIEFEAIQQRHHFDKLQLEQTKRIDDQRDKRMHSYFIILAIIPIMLSILELFFLK